jgi:hypothetical protein
MNNLTYDVVRSITKISKDMIFEIDHIEDWTIGVNYFGDFLNKCESNSSYIGELYKLDKHNLVYMLACVKTSYLIKALQKMAIFDYEKFREFINFLNENKDEIPLAGQIIDRILLLYRITIFPDLFSKDNFVVIYNTIKKNL